MMDKKLMRLMVEDKIYNVRDGSYAPDDATGLLASDIEHYVECKINNIISAIHSLYKNGQTTYQDILQAIEKAKGE